MHSRGFRWNFSDHSTTNSCRLRQWILNPGARCARIRDQEIRNRRESWNRVSALCETSEFVPTTGSVFGTEYYGIRGSCLVNHQKILWNQNYHLRRKHEATLPLAVLVTVKLAYLNPLLNHPNGMRAIVPPPIQSLDPRSTSFPSQALYVFLLSSVLSSAQPVVVSMI